MYDSIIFVFAEMQREAKHAGHQRDELVAECSAPGDRRLGGPGRKQFAQRGTGRRYHHVGSGQGQVRYVGQTRGRSRIRLG